MAILIQGNGGVAAEVGGTTFRGLHVHCKPAEYGSLGHYQAALQTGAIGAGMATDGELLQMRWVDATRLFVLQKMTVNGMRATTAFVAGSIDWKITRVTGWSADGTGGNAVTITGQELRQRTSMGLTLFSTGFRIATTAALGAGTKTLNTNNHGLITTHSSAGISGATPIIGSNFLPIFDLFEQDAADGECPMIQVQNEGIVVRATVPGTGVWNAGFTAKWAEVTAY